MLAKFDNVKMEAYLTNELQSGVKMMQEAT